MIPVEEAVEYAFQQFSENRMQFQLTVIALIEMLMDAEDSKEMEGEMKWYAQIAECINEGTLDSVTYEEKKLFVAMHDSLIGIYEKRSNQ